MGNGVSKISDIFYPDNPSRRRRARELRDQIYNLKAEIDEVNSAQVTILKRARPKLDEVLRQRGFDSPSDLERKVREVLNSSELQKYEDLKKKLDRQDEAQSVMFDIIGLVGVGSGVIAGSAVVLGLISLTAATGILEVVGGILAIVVLVFIGISIIEGANERKDLRDAIDKLWPQRARMKLYLQRMNVIMSSVAQIEIWLNNPVTADPKILDKLLANFESAYRGYTMASVVESLREEDRRNGSWTKEDPNYIPPEQFALNDSKGLARDTIKRAEEPGTVQFALTPEGSDTPYHFSMEMGNFLSAGVCRLQFNEQPYELTAKPLTSQLQWKCALFDLQPLVKSEKAVSLKNCTIQVLQDLDG